MSMTVNSVSYVLGGGSNRSEETGTQSASSPANEEPVESSQPSGTAEDPASDTQSPEPGAGGSSTPVYESTATAFRPVVVEPAGDPFSLDSDRVAAERVRSAELMERMLSSMVAVELGAASIDPVEADNKLRAAEVYARAEAA